MDQKHHPYSQHQLSYTLMNQEPVYFPTLQFLPGSDTQGNIHPSPCERGARCPVCRWVIQGQQVVLHRGCATYFCMPCFTEKRDMLATYDFGPKKGKQSIRCPKCKDDLSLSEPDLGIPDIEFEYTSLPPPSPTAPAGPRTANANAEQAPTQGFMDVDPLWQGQSPEQPLLKTPYGINRRSVDSHYEQVDQVPICKFGSGCKRKNCRFTHPAQREQAEQLGVYQQQQQQHQSQLQQQEQGQQQQQGPQRQQKPGQQHRQAPKCRNGMNCVTKDCRFWHLEQAPMCQWAETCRFKDTCVYSHPGQLKPQQQQGSQQQRGVGGQQQHQAGQQQRGGGGVGQQQQRGGRGQQQQQQQQQQRGRGQQQRGGHHHHQQQRGGGYHQYQNQQQQQGQGRGRGGQPQRQGRGISQRYGQGGKRGSWGRRGSTNYQRPWDGYEGE